MSPNPSTKIVFKISLSVNIKLLNLNIAPYKEVPISGLVSQIYSSCRWGGMHSYNRLVNNTHFNAVMVESMICFKLLRCIVLVSWK